MIAAGAIVSGLSAPDVRSKCSVLGVGHVQRQICVASKMSVVFVVRDRLVDATLSCSGHSAALLTGSRNGQNKKMAFIDERDFVKLILFFY